MTLLRVQPTLLWLVMAVYISLLLDHLQEIDQWSMQADYDL